MKKNMIALAVTAAAALPVHAQSSITLYGVIDEGINYTNNAGDKSAAGVSRVRKIWAAA
jgi:predicted porin